MLISPLLLLTIPAPDVLDVPGDFASIQAAVDAAARGDVVQVAAGTWNESVSVTTGDLTLRGAGADLTSIDANGAGRALEVNAEGVTVEDLALVDGAADVGGALKIVGDDATLRRVDVLDSVSTRLFELGGGAGARIDGDGLLVEDCAFAGNDAGLLNVGAGLWVVGNDARLVATEFVDNGGEYVLGCAAALFGDGHRVEDCLFLANGGDFAECIGLHVDGADGVILRNAFVMNAGFNARACLRLAGSGHFVRDATFLDTFAEFTGAIRCEAEASRISRAYVQTNSESAIYVTGSCELRDVQVRDWYSNYGDPAIWVEGSGGGSMERVLVEGGGFGNQNGVRVDDTTFAAYDVLIANCQLASGFRVEDSTVLLEGCAVVDCEDQFGRMDGSALRLFGASDVMVSNSMFANPDLDHELAPDSGLPTIEYSLVRGGAPGIQVMDAVPTFEGGSADPLVAYRPAIDSPTVDAGDPERLGLRLDLARGARRIDGDFDGTAHVDLGPLERTDSFLRDVGPPGGPQRLRVEGPPFTLGVLVTGWPAAALPLGSWGSVYFELGPTTEVVASIRPTPFEIDVPPGVEPGRIAQGLVLYPFADVGQVTNPLQVTPTEL